MKLLLLAGTGEAVQVAGALHSKGIPAIASYAGTKRGSRDLKIPTRYGGFGGEAGFTQFLINEGITAVLDATHPFAAQMSHRSANVCTHLGLPYRQLLRPAWRPEAGDNWVRLRSEAEAAEHIPAGSTVFLATGRRTLRHYANLSESELICRQIYPPDGPFPFPNGRFLVGTPPFSVEDEIKLFHKLGIDWLVVKNAGGAASASKLEAARLADIKVAMIERPVQPEGQKAATVEEAMAWVECL